MLLSANTTLTPLISNSSNSDFALASPHTYSHKLHSSPKLLTPNSTQRKPHPLSSSVQNPNSLHCVTNNEESAEAEVRALVSSASAVASAIRGASNSPVEFAQRIEKDPKSGLVLPSSDFQRLCDEQLDLFRRIVDPEALLSVCLIVLFKA